MLSRAQPYGSRLRLKREHGAYCFSLERGGNCGRSPLNLHKPHPANFGQIDCITLDLKALRVAKRVVLELAAKSGRRVRPLKRLV